MINAGGTYLSGRPNYCHIFSLQGVYSVASIYNVYLILKLVSTSPKNNNNTNIEHPSL